MRQIVTPTEGPGPTTTDATARIIAGGLASWADMGGRRAIGAKLSSYCLLTSSRRPSPAVAVVYYVSEKAGG
jgi:hypothetical protein